MSYIDSNLLPKEKVVRRAYPHWGVLIAPGIVSGFSMLCVFLLIVSAVGNSRNNPQSSSSVGSLCCFVPLWFFLTLPLLRAIASYISTEFAVTNMRVIAKTGLLRQTTLELMLDKVESIGVDQGMLGRMFDYGTIVVSGSGGTKEGFPNIAAPMVLRKKINVVLQGGTTEEKPKLRRLKSAK
jgi:uncharacterized membrane protein YdbT with pleckstrin-like domain